MSTLCAGIAQEISKGLADNIFFYVSPRLRISFISQPLLVPPTQSFKIAAITHINRTL